MMQTATKPVARDHLFNIRFSDEEQARLNAICTHLGVNAANLIRMMIKEKARDLGVDVPSSPPSKPRAKKR